MQTPVSTEKTGLFRLLKYKYALQRMKKLGFTRVFSDNLADATNGTSIQVRKDFSLFSITGHKKGGYVLEDLLYQINRVLGKEEGQDVVVVGAGKIGTALMEYRGLQDEGFRIAAAFDIDPRKTGAGAAVPVFPVEQLADYVRDHGIRVGIIAVPADVAQQALDAMAAAGVRGVLNFAPLELKSPPDVTISNVNIAMELEKLWYCVKPA